MVEQQIGLMFLEDETRGLGPRRVVPDHVLPRRAMEPADLVRPQDAGRDHLLLHLAVGVGNLGKAPVDGARTGHGDPIDLGRGQSGPVCQVIERRGEDQSALVHPRLDLRRLVGARAHQQAVEEHAVPARSHAGHQRRVVDPGDRRVGDGHRLGGGPFPGEPPQMGHRQRLVAPHPRRKPVESEEDYLPVCRFGLGLWTSRLAGHCREDGQHHNAAQQTQSLLHALSP